MIWYAIFEYEGIVNQDIEFWKTMLTFKDFFKSYLLMFILTFFEIVFIIQIQFILMEKPYNERMIITDITDMTACLHIVKT